MACQNHTLSIPSCFYRATSAGNVHKIIAELGVPIIFADGRAEAERAAVKFLRRAHEVVSLLKNIDGPPALPKNMWTKCSTCGKTRVHAIEEKPNVGLRDWLRVAKRVNMHGVEILGDRIAVCYACREKIRKKTAKLPYG